MYVEGMHVFIFGLIVAVFQGLNSCVRKSVEMLASGCQCTKRTAATIVPNEEEEKEIEEEDSSKPTDADSVGRHDRRNRCLMALFGTSDLEVVAAHSLLARFHHHEFIPV